MTQASKYGYHSDLSLPGSTHHAGRIADVSLCCRGAKGMKLSFGAGTGAVGFRSGIVAPGFCSDRQAGYGCCREEGGKCHGGS